MPIPGFLMVQRHTTRFFDGCALAFVACALWIGTSANAEAGELFPRDHVTFPFAPAAMAEGSGALRFNPAGLGTQPGTEITYYHSYTDTDLPPDLAGDDALYFTSGRMGFSVEWLGAGPIPVGRAYTIGVSSGDQSPLRFGSSYQWRSSDDPIQDKSHFWTHGLRWRPNGHLSLAAVARNYNRMKMSGTRSDAEFVYSAAVQMLDGQLRVGADWYQRTSQAFTDGDYRIAATWTTPNGMTIYADLDGDENYFLGARFNLTQLFAGAHASYHNQDGYRGGVLYAGWHEARRRPVVRMHREVVHLRIGGDIPDRKPPRGLFTSWRPTTFDWITLLDRAATDPDVRAVVVTLDNPQIGWARFEELRLALRRVRAEGKFTVVYCSGTIGNGEYYFATAADWIVVPPVATVGLIGLRAEVTFAKRLLDKLGIEADLEHIGEYKNAADLLTRTSMSVAHREAVDHLLDDFDRQLVTVVAAGRGVDTAGVRRWIDHGPFVSIDAKSAGLIDAVAYADEVRDIVKEQIGRTTAWISAPALARRVYDNRRWGRQPHVAVVFAEGQIRDGRDRHNITGDVMGAETIAGALEAVRNDKQVTAVVLRVNSGGGLITASDAIWHQVELTAKEKPIVVSFADVAASGGYYIACAADSIFALPNTVTGSIGVIHGKINFSGLYDKIGLDKEVLTRGRFADWSGSSRSYDDAERAIVRDQMQRAYDRFVDLVAQGRGLHTDSVDAIGQGRVWSGTAAQELGLIDRFADLHETIAVAARMGGVSSGDQVIVDQWPKPKWSLFSLEGLTGLGALSGMSADLPMVGILRRVAGLIGSAEGETTFELPYILTVE